MAPGLLHPGDLLVEVNGSPVVGLDPEQVIQILVGQLTRAAPGKMNSAITWNLCQMNSQGTILFKVVPNQAPASSSLQSVRSSRQGCGVNQSAPVCTSPVQAPPLPRCT